jgi:hypothetical protein
MPDYTRPHQFYNVTGTGTTDDGRPGAITKNTAGELIGPVPSGSALNVELIDPVSVFGQFLTGAIGNPNKIARVFRSTTLTQSSAETNWIVALADGGFFKMMGLRVIIVTGSARVYQFGSRYTADSPPELCDLTAANVSVAFDAGTSITDYHVNWIEAVVFTDTPAK